MMERSNEEGGKVCNGKQKGKKKVRNGNKRRKKIPSATRLRVRSRETKV